MARLPQTLARIGAGLSTLGALIWLLWPTELGEFLDPEPLFVFSCALVLWIITEFKLSEEVQLRNSSQNDIRLARRLIGYHAEQFRIMLRDHDWHNMLPVRYLGEACLLQHEHETGKAFFQDRKLQPVFEQAMLTLKSFNNYLGTHSAPEMFGNDYGTSIAPRRRLGDWDEDPRILREIKTANELATEAWQVFDQLITRVKISIPEAMDEVIEPKWFTNEGAYRHFAPEQPEADLGR